MVHSILFCNDRVLSELPPDSLGAYIISMARTASDVLAVVLLQRECGIKETLRVVGGGANTAPASCFPKAKQ
jgi:phosphoenolpyruvate carboxylase